MSLIEALCERHELAFNWVSEAIEITDTETEAVIKAAIQQIR